MFLLWGGLAGWYLVSSFQLLLSGGEPGGAAIQLAVAAALGVLCWRSFRKRKKRLEEKKNLK